MVVSEGFVCPAAPCAVVVKLRLTKIIRRLLFLTRHVGCPTSACEGQTATLLSLFLHLGPYARQIIAATDKAIADIESDAFAPPPLVATPRDLEALPLSA